MYVLFHFCATPRPVQKKKKKDFPTNQREGARHKRDATARAPQRTRLHRVMPLHACQLDVDARSTKGYTAINSPLRWKPDRQ